jgi:hypothetical protein
MCEPCRKAYGRARRSERYWTPERIRAAAQAAADRVEAESVARNHRYGLPDATTWSAPLEQCACGYCEAEGMHPDLPAAELAEILEVIEDWYAMGVTNAA